MKRQSCLSAGSTHRPSRLCGRKRCRGDRTAFHWWQESRRGQDSCHDPNHVCAFRRGIVLRLGQPEPGKLRLQRRVPIHRKNQECGGYLCQSRCVTAASEASRLIQHLKKRHTLPILIRRSSWTRFSLALKVRFQAGDFRDSPIRFLRASKIDRFVAAVLVSLESLSRVHRLAINRCSHLIGVVTISGRG